MTETRTIPADDARQIANILRQVNYASWADVLDPKPRSLRDEVVDAVSKHPTDDYAATDAALAVVKARIDALPYVTVPLPEYAPGRQRAYTARSLDALFGGGA